MNELRTWTFSGSEVRTVEVNGEPWWVLKDVCTVLEIKNHKEVPDRLEPDEVGRFDVPHPQNPAKPLEMVFINESGLYSVILRSDKPQAKPFRKWVTSEVLPSIRKTGAYALRDSYQIEDPIERAKRWIEEQQEKKQLQLTVSVQNQQIAELQPKASYYDVVLNCKDLMSITEIAKDYGKSAKWMNNYLHEKGIQFKQSGIWLLYAKYADKGYTSTKTQTYNGYDGTVHSKVHTYWTQAGRLFLYALLKADGILPIVERAA
ncbi:MAG: phage antirepressor KilAC domain-containing protein [Oscillospiraceae bacterium]|nr:phage antirepressor KilAC domain-containing protein [Oscillospiraceae bacterium]